jgi:hypothetical protein
MCFYISVFPYCYFLDLSKAFDTVSIPLLMQKLEFAGIRGIALSIFRDYLTNRAQCVKVGNCLSEDARLTYGEPQGSVLGPTLFLLYVNSLCRLSLPNCNIIAYADDTALVVHGKDWAKAKQHTEYALREIMKWLNGNLLTLNLDKSKYITFTPRVDTQPSPDYCRPTTVPA